MSFRIETVCSEFWACIEDFKDILLFHTEYEQFQAQWDAQMEAQMEEKAEKYQIMKEYVIKFARQENEEIRRLLLENIC